jgi:hypothetical protein
MNLIYLDAVGVILAIQSLSAPPPAEFSQKLLVPDASKYAVGDNLRMVNATPVPAAPVPPPITFTPPGPPQAPPSLDPRVVLWEAIKIERDRRQKDGVKVGEFWFHSDSDSRIQQLALVMMGANMPAGIAWKTLSGAFTTMTPQLAAQIFQAEAASDIALFAHAEALNAQLQASEDPASFNVLAGWPTSFSDTLV